MPPAIAKIGTCKLRFCERLNLNFNIATCAGGLVSMGVRLPEKPALAQCLTHSPRARTRISSGRASKKCRRKPLRGDRLPGGCRRFATVRRRKSNSSSGGAVYELAAPPGQNLRRTWQRNLLRHRGSVWNTPTRARCKVCGKGRVRQNSAANGRHGARHWALDDPPVRTA